MKLKNLHCFAMGLVYDCSQKFDIFYISFFLAKLIEECSSPWLLSFKLIRKSVNRHSLYKTSYCRQQKRWYLKVIKFTFFAKALVHDFLVENFMFFNLSFFCAKWIKRVFGSIRDTKNYFLVYKNIDISKLQNLNFLQRC